MNRDVSRRAKKKKPAAARRRDSASSQIQRRAASSERRAALFSRLTAWRGRPRLSQTLEEAMHRDQVLLNNAVLVQGLALTPVVAAASTLRNAAVLALMGLLLITPVRVLGELATARTPGRLRIIIYALISGAIYIPALAAVNYLFGAGAVGAGIYLPALAADAIVLSRSEITAREGAAQAARNGLSTTLGFALALAVCGALRELLGEGRLLGLAVLDTAPLPVASTVAGGFIAAALCAAALQWVTARYVKFSLGGGRVNE